MDSGFHNQQPGFWITIMVGFWIPLAGFRIPKPWIPDSTDQNYLDSGFRIPDYLTWGDTLDAIKKCINQEWCTQSMCSKSLGKKREAKRHIDALNFSKGMIKEKGIFDPSFLHLHKIFYILQVPGLIQTAKWRLKS